MATSGSTNYKATRKDIIWAALRVLGVTTQGMAPTNSNMYEGSVALNYLIKELGVSHGMPIWKVRTCSPITMVAGQTAYTIGLDNGKDIQQQAPLKILDAWLRTPQNTDQPVNLISKSIYDSLGSKFASGTPNQLFYSPPGAINWAEQWGTIYLYLTPDAITVSNYTLLFTGHYPFDDLDSDSDVIDFPNYWMNALKWGLADQLSYEYGLGVTERAQITKKANEHIQKAMEGNPEEGSLFIQPRLHLPNP